MLSDADVERVQALLAEGVSQRRVAALTGYTRNTVASIFHGRRQKRAERPAKKLDKEPFDKRGPIMRCPTCGGLVFPPCLACKIRSQGPGARDQRSDGPLQLELKPAHRKRYEQIKRTCDQETCDESIG